MISAGLGAVPVAQTFLDIGQGNRVNENLYDGDAAAPVRPRRPRCRARLWERTLERADSAPADIVPGLLVDDAARTPGSRSAAEADSGLATLIGVDEDGAVAIVARGRLRSRLRARASASCALASRELRPLVAGLGPDDLLIAIARRGPCAAGAPAGRDRRRAATTAT